jgi:hypothetical protein
MRFPWRRAICQRALFPEHKDFSLIPMIVIHSPVIQIWSNSAALIWPLFGSLARSQTEQKTA